MTSLFLQIKDDLTVFVRGRRPKQTLMEDYLIILLMENNHNFFSKIKDNYGKHS